MILLINHRYPALGPIVGAFVGLIMMVAGVLLGSTMMVVWGAPSVALGCLRAVQQVRQSEAR